MTTSWALLRGPRVRGTISPSSALRLSVQPHHDQPLRDEAAIAVQRANHCRVHSQLSTSPQWQSVEHHLQNFAFVNIRLWKVHVSEHDVGAHSPLRFPADRGQDTFHRETSSIEHPCLCTCSPMMAKSVDSTATSTPTCAQWKCSEEVKRQAMAYFGHDILSPRPTLARPTLAAARPTLARARPTLATTFNLANMVRFLSGQADVGQLRPPPWLRRFGPWLGSFLVGRLILVILATYHAAPDRPPPKISLSFFSHPHFHSFILSLGIFLCLFFLSPGVFSWNLGQTGPQMCLFLPSSCPVKPRRPAGRRGFPHDNLRAKTSTFEVLTDQTPPKFHEETPGERKKRHKKIPRERKNEQWWWEKEKKARNFGPLPFRPPTLRAPALQGLELIVAKVGETMAKTGLGQSRLWPK